MNEDFRIALLLVGYHVATLLVGLGLAYLGYNLFCKGVFEKAGDIEAKFGQRHLLVKQAAPGTFFALFGAIVMCVGLWRGINISSEFSRGAGRSDPVQQSSSAVENKQPSVSRAGEAAIVPESELHEVASSPARFYENGAPVARGQPHQKRRLLISWPLAGSHLSTCFRVWGGLLGHAGASNLIPGPSSTEMAIHIGHQRAGWRGLAVAGICFILPAMLMVMVFASAYTRFGSLPEIQSGLYGVKPVIIAVILQAFWGLSRAAVKNPFLAAVGLAATIAALAGLNVLVVLLAAGRVASASVAIREPRLSCHPASLAFLLPSSALSVAVPVSLSGVFVVFLKFGAVIFGSGYVLLAFLQADLVTRLHWLSQAQLLDAVAVGR